jgi:hypothetical protein
MQMMDARRRANLKIGLRLSIRVVIASFASSAARQSRT